MYFDGTRVGGRAGGSPLADALAAKKITIPLPIVDSAVLEPLRSSGFIDLWRDQPQLTAVPEWSDPRWSDRNGYLRDPNRDPIRTHAWQYADRTSYRTNSYPRPAVALRTLEAVVGEAAFLRGMRGYAETWRYRHPYPEDFYASFQAGAGVDVDWYFRELFEGTGTVDWSVSVEQRRRADPIGFFQSEGGEFFEQPADEGPTEDEEDDGRPWRSEILIRREGELRLALPVRLTFEDGTVEEFVWTREDQGERNWLRIERLDEAKLESVRLDPERSYYIDADMSNNQWYDDTENLTPLRWGERVLAQYQRTFHWMAGIGG